MGGRKEFVVSNKTPFAEERHEVFEMREKKRKVREAGRESKKIALLEVYKVEYQDELCRGRSEVCCVHEADTE